MHLGGVGGAKMLQSGGDWTPSLLLSSSILYFDGSSIGFPEKKKEMKKHLNIIYKYGYGKKVDWTMSLPIQKCQYLRNKTKGI